MYKLRVLFRKYDRLKFISHLELMRSVERTFRRMKLPLEFSKGFNPHLKMNFAMPLSVGVSSDYELLEVELNEHIDEKEFVVKSKEYLPKGLEFLDAKYVEGKDSLMSLVKSAKYALHFKCNNIEEFKSNMDKALNSDEVLVTKLNKKNKEVTKNIRPLLHGLNILNTEDNEMFITMSVSCGSEGNLKPDDFISAVSGEIIEQGSIRIHRLCLYGVLDDVQTELFDL